MNGGSSSIRIPTLAVSIHHHLIPVECKGSTIHLLKKGTRPVATDFKRKRIPIAMSLAEFKAEEEAAWIESEDALAKAELKQLPESLA